MGTITIDYFHDPLCCWCYGMSPRLRRLKAAYDHIEVVHRAYILFPSEHSANKYIKSLGGEEAYLREMCCAWERANKYDEDERFCLEKLPSAICGPPCSMPGLLACEAARLQGGERCAWDMFDALQKAYFTDGRDVCNYDVLRDVALSLGLNCCEFMCDYESQTALKRVKSDNAYAHERGVDVIPTVMVGESSLTLPSYDELEEWILGIQNSEG